MKAGPMKYEKCTIPLCLWEEARDLIMADCWEVVRISEGLQTVYLRKPIPEVMDDLGEG